MGLQRLIKQSGVQRVRIITCSFSTPRHDLKKQQQVPWQHTTLERQLRFKEAGQRGDTLFNVLVDHRKIETFVLVQVLSLDVFAVCEPACNLAYHPGAAAALQGGRAAWGHPVQRAGGPTARSRPSS